MEKEKAEAAVRGVIDTNVVADKTIREVERIDYAVRKAGGSAGAGVSRDVAISAMYVWNLIRRYRYTDKGESLTIRQFNAVAEDARLRFLQQHILNYCTFRVLSDFYEWLCDKHLMNRQAEGFWRKIRRCFEDYQRVHMEAVGDISTFSTFDDNMRLSFENIREGVESLEVSVRDYLIQHIGEIKASGQKNDIAVLQKAVVCFMFLNEMQRFFKYYFAYFIDEYGVDFSSDFRYAKLDKMIPNTMWMCEKLGLRFGKDSEDDTVFLGVSTNNSVRVSGAWKSIVSVLSDGAVIDDTAMRAINLSKEQLERYNSRMSAALAKEMAKEAEQERIALEDGLRKLQDKYARKAS